MAERSRFRTSLSLVLAVLGTLALIGSFVWPMVDDGRSAWSDEQAERYSEVTQRMHVLGFRGPDAVDEDPAEIRAEFERLEAELREAQGRSGRISRGLSVAALVLIGAAWWIGRGASPGGLRPGGRR